MWCGARAGEDVGWRKEERKWLSGRRASASARERRHATARQQRGAQRRPAKHSTVRQAAGGRHLPTNPLPPHRTSAGARPALRASSSSRCRRRSSADIMPMRADAMEVYACCPCWPAGNGEALQRWERQRREGRPAAAAAAAGWCQKGAQAGAGAARVGGCRYTHDTPPGGPQQAVAAWRQRHWARGGLAPLTHLSQRLGRAAALCCSELRRRRCSCASRAGCVWREAPESLVRGLSRIEMVQRHSSVLVGASSSPACWARLGAALEAAPFAIWLNIKAAGQLHCSSGRRPAPQLPFAHKRRTIAAADSLHCASRRAQARETCHDVIQPPHSSGGAADLHSGRPPALSAARAPQTIP